MIVVDASGLTNALTDDGTVRTHSRTALAGDAHLPAPGHLFEGLGVVLGRAVTLDTRASPTPIASGRCRSEAEHDDRVLTVVDLLQHPPGPVGGYELVGIDHRTPQSLMSARSGFEPRPLDRANSCGAPTVFFSGDRTRPHERPRLARWSRVVLLLSPLMIRDRSLPNRAAVITTT